MVVVFTPPAVEPVEPPTTMSTSTMSSVPSRRRLRFSELKPAVLGVTAINIPESTFSKAPMPSMELEPHSIQMISREGTMIRKEVTVMTNFVCSL